MVKRKELHGLPLTEHSINYFLLKKFFIIDTDVVRLKDENFGNNRRFATNL